MNRPAAFLSFLFGEEGNEQACCFSIFLVWRGELPVTQRGLQDSCGEFIRTTSESSGIGNRTVKVQGKRVLPARRKIPSLRFTTVGKSGYISISR